jgi:hypothetical protein
MNKKQPTRREILQDILECFQQIYQWNLWCPSNTLEYYHKAEALIELLEVVDCGSVGGFDYANASAIHTGTRLKPLDATGHELFDRFLMVLGKYPTKLNKVCDHSVEFFAEWLKNVQSL